MIDLDNNTLLEIAISNAKGMRAPVVRELLQRIGSLRNFFALSQLELTNLSGFSSEIFIDSYRESLLREAYKELEFVKSHYLDTVFIDTDAYPERLAACDDAPVIIYKMGNCDLSEGRFVGVVGTRHATAYGIDFTTKLVNDLAAKLDNLVIVSGLAYGIDVAAHKASLSAGIPTIGVLAHGLNMIYPAEHRSVAAKMASSGGALITEYPTTAQIHRSNFLERNRIVAGLCDCLVVVESDFRGGSMSTARIASQYSRDVFALPGRISDKFSHGTNALIKRHVASLIVDADSLIEQMGWDTKSQSDVEPPTLFRPLSVEEQFIVDFIKENPDATVNDICVRLNKSYSLVSNILFQLEMDDFIITLPGGRYAVAI